MVVLAPSHSGASQVVLVVKNLPANAVDVRDVGSILGSGRYPGVGHGNPLQYPCLENPIDRGAWRFTVHGAAKTRTCLKVNTNLKVLIASTSQFCTGKLALS